MVQTIKYLLHNFEKYKRNQDIVATVKLLPDQKDILKMWAAPRENISHEGVEIMPFLESISLRCNIKIKEFQCLADYNCPFVASWYSMSSNLLAN